MRLLYTLLLSFLTVLPGLMSGEIKEVSLFWNSVICNPKCGELLGKGLQKIPGVAEMNIDSNSGVAVLKWRPESPFSYSSVKFAAQMVGVGYTNVRIRARGEVKSQGRTVFLISSRDKTRIILISPLAPKQGQYTPRPHPSMMTLNEDIKTRLLTAAKKGKMIVIEGPLYQPQSSLPLTVMLERAQIEK